MGKFANRSSHSTNTFIWCLSIAKIANIHDRYYDINCHSFIEKCDFSCVCVCVYACVCIYWMDPFPMQTIHVTIDKIEQVFNSNLTKRVHFKFITIHHHCFVPRGSVHIWHATFYVMTFLLYNLWNCSLTNLPYFIVSHI